MRPSSGRDVIIQKLILQIDLKKIKDLQMLLSLLREVEDYANGKGCGTFWPGFRKTSRRTA